MSVIWGIRISEASGIIPVGVVMCNRAGEDNEATFFFLLPYDVEKC